MRITPRQKRIAFAVLAIATVTLVAGELVARSTPAGVYRSYRLIPHHSTDAIHFTNGTVRWFACGTTAEGTYHRSADGTWVWDWRTGRVTNTFLLRPHLFWLTMIDTAEPTNVFRLRRAASVPDGDNAHH